MPDITDVQPLYLQSLTNYAAKDLRRGTIDLIGPGVPSLPDFRVTSTGGLNVGVAGGTCYVLAVGTPDGGLYRVRTELGSYTVAIPANTSGTNPRLDQIVVRIYDTSLDPGAGANKASVEVVTGDNTVGGATLDNRNGARSLATFLAAGTRSTLLLADVLTPTSSGSVTAGAVRDRRQFIVENVVPPLDSGTGTDSVTFIPHSGLRTAPTTIDNTYSGTQSAALCYLPRKITASGFQWRYVQGATASTASFTCAICDSSGRLILSGTQALTGGTGTAQNWNPTFTPVTLMPGQYWVFWGGNITGAGASIVGMMINMNVGATIPGISPVARIFYHVQGVAGPSSFPTTNTILALNDNITNSNNNYIPVPVMTLIG